MEPENLQRVSETLQKVSSRLLDSSTKDLEDALTYTQLGDDQIRYAKYAPELIKLELERRYRAQSTKLLIATAIIAGATLLATLIPHIKH